MSAVPAQVHLTAGALSSLAAVLSLQPLDLLKTRVQQQGTARLSLWSTIRAVIQHDGPRGLWRGTAPTLVRNVPGVSLYFLALAELRTLASGYALLSTGQQGKNGKHRLTPLGDLLVGAFARTSVGYVLMPATVLKTIAESTARRQGDTSLGTMRRVWRTHGLRGLFRGAVPTALRDAPGAGLFLLFYDRTSALLPSSSSSSSSSGAGQASLGGGASGTAASALSTVLTTPFDVIRTRRQVSVATSREIAAAAGASSAAPAAATATATLRKTATLRSLGGGSSSDSMLGAAREIATQDGILGFWRGAALRIVRKAAASGIAWATYEGLVARHAHKRSSRLSSSNP